ncbi:hypothetical protein [Huintestinicola butyrica]|uniref:hypothetical protein n=1 Tax=Huintestinicola butyrica TaxID=2981728 RepID=UPI003F7E689F
MLRKKVKEYTKFFTKECSDKKKLLFQSSGEKLIEQMNNTLNIVCELDPESSNMPVNHLDDGECEAKGTKCIKAFYYQKTFKKAWKFISEYCSAPQLEPVLPYVIFTVLCNFTSVNIGKILQKNHNNWDDDDINRLADFFFEPKTVGKLKPNKSIYGWRKTQAKIYELFYIVMTFYLILSLPICKNADVKNCLDLAEKSMENPILLYIFSKNELFLSPEKPDVSKTKWIKEIQNVGDKLKSDREQINRLIDKAIDGIDFTKTYDDNVKMLNEYIKQIARYKNSLAYRLTIFEGRCIDAVIESNQYAEFFLKLFKFEFSADDIILVGRYDLVTKNEKKGVDNSEPIEDLDDELKPIENIRVINVTKFYLKRFCNQMGIKTTKKPWPLGFNGRFLFANDENESLIKMDNAVILGVQGEIPLCNTRNNIYHSMKIAKCDLSAVKAVFKNIKVQPYKGKNRDLSNIRQIYRSLLGLNFVSIYYYDYDSMIKIGVDFID